MGKNIHLYPLVVWERKTRREAGNFLYFYSESPSPLRVPSLNPFFAFAAVTFSACSPSNMFRGGLRVSCHIRPNIGGEIIDPGLVGVILLSSTNLTAKHDISVDVWDIHHGKTR